MSGLFVIDPQWKNPTDHGREEIRQTSALLRIAVNNRLVTRVDNEWVGSVHETVRLSAYPLALWLAASWWRLLWEPVPTDTPDAVWRLAHEMRSAGHGYLWPPVRFETDGETVTVHALPTEAGSTEKIRHLVRLHETIPVTGFVRGVETFIQTVIARLDRMGIPDTELHALWQEVCGERTDPGTATYRKMEALLGFEPDEAPEDVADTLQQLVAKAGEAAVAEIAAACANSEPGPRLERMMRQSRLPGVQGSMGIISAARGAVTRGTRSASAPWERGWAMARVAREHLRLDGRPVSNRRLGEILEVTERELTGGDAPMADAPLSLAVRPDSDDRINLLFRRRGITGRRFEMARWFADGLMASDTDRWLPVTDTKTARQKVQRAFAAEFLAPVGSLQEFLGHALTDDERIEEAGAHFCISPLAIRSHLVNHGLVSLDDSGMGSRIEPLCMRSTAAG